MGRRVLRGRRPAWTMKSQSIRRLGSIGPASLGELCICPWPEDPGATFSEEAGLLGPPTGQVGPQATHLHARVRGRQTEVVVEVP